MHICTNVCITCKCCVGAMLKNIQHKPSSAAFFKLTKLMPGEVHCVCAVVNKHTYETVIKGT